MRNGRQALSALILFTVLLGATMAAPTPQPADTSATVARGKYLVVIAGCNDCHTSGWRESDGNVPVSAWLTGSNVGFRSASGTSYPTNLRLEFQITSEDNWTKAVLTRADHSMMTWQDLRGLTPADRHAVYVFIRSLGPAGTPTLPDVRPWDEPLTPYVDLREQQPQH